MPFNNILLKGWSKIRIKRLLKQVFMVRFTHYTEMMANKSLVVVWFCDQEPCVFGLCRLAVDIADLGV
jgi:hypothetical protein